MESGSRPRAVRNGIVFFSSRIRNDAAPLPSPVRPQREPARRESKREPGATAYTSLFNVPFWNFADEPDEGVEDAIGEEPASESGEPKIRRKPGPKPKLRD